MGLRNADSKKDLVLESSPLEPESIQRNQWSIYCCLEGSYPRFQTIGYDILRCKFEGFLVDVCDYIST